MMRLETVTRIAMAEWGMASSMMGKTCREKENVHVSTGSAMKHSIPRSHVSPIAEASQGGFRGPPPFDNSHLPEERVQLV